MSLAAPTLPLHRPMCDPGAPAGAEAQPPGESRVGASSIPPSPGTAIAGKYHVQRTLGMGGMGVVVEAIHAALGQRVAIKLLRRDIAVDDDALQRFLREAQIAAQLPGDHIARAIDFGQTDGSEAYLVMELLEGSDLEAALQRRGPFSVAEAVTCVLQACEGVAEAHAVGLVHRDLKPANLFLTARRDGSPLVKVLDFGISKWVLGDVRATVTAQTSGGGTPAYMAPEQFRAPASVDARCDQHALGAVLYELMAGKPPFPASTLPELAMKIVFEPPPSLRSVVPEVPEEG